MPIVNRIAEFHNDMTAWRHHLHAHPETAFEEVKTANFVAEKLQSFGIEISRGLAKTGVVGTLSTGDGPTLGLRADMDALNLTEINDFDYKSTIDGKMHGCGHDGHTTMLLGAARYLAETKNFKGTIHFIFQPAEENEAGGGLMVEEGLFEQFPCDSIYGMHNMPGLPVGQFAIKPGPTMASADIFEITITGKGAHGAMPHMGIDPIVIGSQIVTALQAIIGRNVHPLLPGVVSVTQFTSGDTFNVIPEVALLRGTTRAFHAEVQDFMEARIQQTAEAICAMHGASMEWRYERRYPTTVNHPAETEIAAAAAVELVGTDNVGRDPQSTMGAEDFSFMMNKVPGAYMWIGNGPSDGGRNLHNPAYDFNDEVLPYGASLFATLAQTILK